MNHYYSPEIQSCLNEHSFAQQTIRVNDSLATLTIEISTKENQYSSLTAAFTQGEGTDIYDNKFEILKSLESYLYQYVSENFDQDITAISYIIIDASRNPEMIATYTLQIITVEE